MEEYHKDMLVLVLVGLIAIEVGGLLLSFSIAIALAGGADYLAEHGLTLENVIRFFVENPMALGLALLISHIFITLTRTYIVVRYSHKHGLSWHEQLKGFCRLDRTRLLRFSLVLALVLALELPTTFLFGAPRPMRNIGSTWGWGRGRLVTPWRWPTTSLRASGLQQLWSCAPSGPSGAALPSFSSPGRRFISYGPGVLM